MVFALSMQTGQYAAMAENIARMGAGHLQIQTPEYLDNPDLERTIPGASALISRIRALPSVNAALPRAATFALVSSGERTAGAQIVAVDPQAEAQAMILPQQIAAGGRYLRDINSDETVIGAALAINLGIGIGDQMVILGTGLEGSVATTSLTVVGLIDSGVAELDRGLVHVPMNTFRDAFELGDACNSIVLMADNQANTTELATEIGSILPAGLSLRNWDDVRPELSSLMEVKRLGGYFFFVLLGTMVTFSIVNTFVMTVFERTREFGMLMAVGLTPGRLQWMLQLESVLLCGAGVLAGALISVALVLYLAKAGIPVPASAGSVMRQFQMPSRLYPSFDLAGLLWPSVLMFVATQAAAFLPGMHIRRLHPVEALRAT